jgi:hypothetical protein
VGEAAQGPSDGAADAGHVVRAGRDQPGRAVQVDPIKPTLKAPGSKLSTRRCDGPLSNFAFNLNLLNLRRYNPVKFMLQPHYPQWRRRIKLAITGQGGCCLARKRKMKLKLLCRLNARTYAHAWTPLASANQPSDLNPKP